MVISGPADTYLMEAETPVSVVGFGMVNVSSKANSDILQMAKMKEKYQKHVNDFSIFHLMGLGSRLFSFHMRPIIAWPEPM